MRSTRSATRRQNEAPTTVPTTTPPKRSRTVKIPKIVDPPAPNTSKNQKTTDPPAPKTAKTQKTVDPPAPKTAKIQKTTDPPAPKTAKIQKTTDPPAPKTAKIQKTTDPPAPKTAKIQKTFDLPAKVPAANSSHLTPVNAKRKNKVDSISKDRLNWKSRCFGVPVTSTPKPAKHTITVTKEDIDTCFGFEDSDNENYDALISPIAEERLYIKGDEGHDDFNALLARYKPEADDDLEIHFNPSARPKTYSNRQKAQDIHPEPLVRQRSNAEGHQKSSRKTKLDKHDMNSEAQKWMDQQNKEFDDVLHVPLIVTKRT
ncbi:mucin-2 isoform X2 [Folsomia candida]|uniref:mucin-2 isoform X2 n=1 Tax=Folsomia candida TaxID=158441 RepID=UPI000B8F62E5|nr:mucin-2 isoform X2 [Folsomia candida]